MKRRIALCLLLCLGIGQPLVFSQEAPGEKPLTLEECIQIALKKRPELMISTLDIAQAEFQVKEAQSYYYPHLTMNAGYTHFSSPTIIDATVNLTSLVAPINPFILAAYGIELPAFFEQRFPIGQTNWSAVTLDLAQPLYTFGRIDEAVKQARIGRSLATTQKEKKGLEVVFEVKKMYCQFLAAREMVQLLKEGETRASVVSKMVKIAYETAVPEKEEKGTTRIDYLKARNFLSEIKVKLGEMEKNLKLAELGLKMAMGLDSSASLTLAKIPLEGLPRVSWNLEEMKEKTLSKNVDLRSVDLGVQFYESKRKAAGKEYLPKIGIFGQYIGPEDRYGNNNVWYAGVGITLSLFDGFLTKAKVGQAEAQFQKIRGQKLVLEKGLSVQIDHLNLNLTEVKERMDLLRAAIQEAQERVSLASEGYAAGITEFDEVLYAQKTELEMKSNYLQGLLLYQVTKSEIEFILGDP